MTWKRIKLVLIINLSFVMNGIAKPHFEQGLYTDYQNVLDSIPAQIDLTDQEADYHTTFNNLYNQIKAWKLDSMPLPLLDSSQLVWLQNFYESNPKMPGIGHALLAINDTSYNITDPVYITDTTVFSGPEPFMLNSSSLKNNKESLIKFYPNPTDKEVILEWKDRKLSKDTKVIVMDAQGKIILQLDWISAQKILKLDLEGQPIGIYYLGVSEKNKIIETYKIVLIK